MNNNGDSQNRIRRCLALFIGLVAMIPVLMGCGGQPPKVYHVGILSGLDSMAGIADGFKAKMTELGYVEGKTVVYDLQKTNADSTGEQRVVRQFVTNKVDLIFAFPLGAVQTAKDLTKGTNIPVVFANSAVEGTGLVESVKQPGGNITGVRSLGPELTVKRFELLLQLMPALKRVWITYNTNYAANKPSLNALRPAVQSKGVTLVEVPVTSLDGIRNDLQARAAANVTGMDAILIMPDDLSMSPQGWTVITDFAAKHKVPVVGSTLVQVGNGAIFSYNTDFAEVGGLAAQLGDKVLKGIPAGTLPVFSPEPRLKIDLKVAKAIGITVPDGMLRMTSEVIR